jgi:hypothetical protein
MNKLKATNFDAGLMKESNQVFFSIDQGHLLHNESHEATFNEL